MKPSLIALALVAFPLLGSQAFAAQNCAVPETAAQSKEALQQKLETEGWQVRQIKLENGCYEVYAVKADGSRLETEFNTASLDNVGDNDDGGDDNSNRDDDNGSDDNGSDDNGSDDNGSDDNGSESDGDSED